MFCTKCGKELYDGDKFCAYCGAAVREPKLAKYDDVVFNPPFKIEAVKIYAAYYYQSSKTKGNLHA